jgi:hypothetical protein
MPEEQRFRVWGLADKGNMRGVLYTVPGITDGLNGNASGNSLSPYRPR